MVECYSWEPAIEILLDFGAMKDDHTYAGLRGITSGRPQGRQLQVSGILKPGTCVLSIAFPYPGERVLRLKLVVRFSRPKLESVTNVLALSVVHNRL